MCGWEEGKKTVVNVMHEHSGERDAWTQGAEKMYHRHLYCKNTFCFHQCQHTYTASCMFTMCCLFLFYCYFFASSIYCRKSHSCFCIHQSDAQFLFTTPLQCVPEDVPGFPLCHISLQTWCISWRKTWCSSAWEHAQRAPCKTERQKILEHNEFKLCVNLN